MRLRLAAVCLSGLLSACSLPPGDTINSDRLDTVLDSAIGGAGTCLDLRNVRGGGVVYEYGDKGVCSVRLPPCSTFDVPAALTALDAGVITPQTVYKWDGSPQPVTAWQTDAAVGKAFGDGILWWWEDLSRNLGHDRMVQALERFGYGDQNANGPAGRFWLGPRNGGVLALSTREQAGFLQRFYNGGLGVKVDASQVVQTLMIDEVREDSKQGKAVFSAVDGDCPINVDGSRTVVWVAGRLQTPQRDLVYAATLTGEAPPPAIELRQKLKDAFAEAGLWPNG